MRRVARRNSLLFVAVLLSVLFIFLFTNKLTLKANSSHETYKYYTSVVVSAGDTLWSIADTYMTPEYHDKAEYISEIKELNHLGTDDIHAGQNIIVAYYSSEVL